MTVEARVRAVNVGRPRRVAVARGEVETAIWKAPVAGRVAVGGVNLAGDDQADRTLSQSHKGQGSVGVSDLGAVSAAYEQAGAELMLVQMLPDPGDALGLLRTIAAELM